MAMLTAVPRGNSYSTPRLAAPALGTKLETLLMEGGMAGTQNQRELLRSARLELVVRTTIGNSARLR
jgi:hypothetical protein